MNGNGHWIKTNWPILVTIVVATLYIGELRSDVDKNTERTATIEAKLDIILCKMGEETACVRKTK